MAFQADDGQNYPPLAPTRCPFVTHSSFCKSSQLVPRFTCYGGTRQRNCTFVRDVQVLTILMSGTAQKSKSKLMHECGRLVGGGIGIRSSHMSHHEKTGSHYRIRAFHLRKMS